MWAAQNPDFFLFTVCFRASFFLLHFFQYINNCRNDGNSANCKMHYVDWSGNGGTQHGHYLYDPFEDEAALLFGNHHHICPEMKKALQGVFLIAEQKKRIEESTKVSFFTKLYISKYYYGQLGLEGLI